MLKNGLQSLLIFLVTAFSWQLGFADHEATPATMRALENVLPHAKPDRIAHSPIPGLYELTYGPDVVYVTEDGHYLLQGDVFDVQKRENITAPKRQQARLNAINALGEKNMIIFAPKQAKYQVTVFTDVECGYCRKLHQEMSELNGLGIKVRYLAFPRAGIGSPTYDKMVSVWCADDPQKAITDAKADRPVPPKQCDNPVSDEYNLGRALGVTGTPTLILENGQVIPGYVPAQRLVQMLEAEKSKTATR
jgi:thiol:disulfide interchange protein DsbC